MSTAAPSAMPSRRVLIGAYVGFVVVILLVFLYMRSGTSTTTPTTTTPVVTNPPVTTTPVVTTPTSQVVIRNDGTVSGTRYCAGVNKASWWNELPTTWLGAKCSSAGFNATGTPTGVDCNTVPGQKAGFRVLCVRNDATPWAQ